MRIFNVFADIFNRLSKPMFFLRMFYSCDSAFANFKSVLNPFIYRRFAYVVYSVVLCL